MTCTIYQELLSAWLDNELSGFEQQELREHLDQCPDCRAAWKDMGCVQKQVDHLTGPDVPLELWERITTVLDKDTAPAVSEKIIYYTTARGRMLNEREGKTSCLNTRFSRRSLH